MLPDLLVRRQTHFVLWRPGHLTPPPCLFIGALSQWLTTYENFQNIPLIPDPDFPDLWMIPATDCGLTEGQVYAYWFKVKNTNPYPFTGEDEILYCTDPLATTVDRRPSRLAPTPSEPGGVASQDPASIVLYRQSRLYPCDPDGKEVHWSRPPAPLPANNTLVIYELPPRWVRPGSGVGTGSFRDLQALLDPDALPPSHPELNHLVKGRAHLLELGVNALELLPPADSEDVLEWGYGTANFLAADHDLGVPEGAIAPHAMTDLAHLVELCHQYGVRVFIDVVMAFARNHPYQNINFLDFFVHWGSGDPEQANREGFGGDLFKYNYWVEGYHPLSGEQTSFCPSREYMKIYLAHWLEQYRVDGLRLDSINNVGNYDFIEEVRHFSRAFWRDREGEDEQFLVVGEELSVPIALIHQGRVDGLWNEKFKQAVRQVILGKPGAGDRSFEWTVRKLIDCRFLGFKDGTQVVNYLTSHDVGGYGNERIYDYLVNQGITETQEIERRLKLAFVCLLTAVGIPLILAGDEFGDCHDLDLSNEHTNHKQVDPVNFERLQEPWRQDLFRYVARLVKFRTLAPALALNDTDVLHIDYAEGKKVIVWQRGTGRDRVIVVANFSDYGTPDPFSPKAEYVVPRWPKTPNGLCWHEVTQDRVVLPHSVGREPIFPWEAKIYHWVETAV
ncbi:MAG: alpha-amylase family glycosyl hydrolase [Cyanobacteria bacterium P01_G01_bin.54]